MNRCGLRGSGFIELPDEIRGKRAVVNLKNTFNECFKWSVLSALHYDEVYAKNRKKANDAVSYRQWRNELNFDGIDFPVKLNQLDKFMEQNSHLAINVYYFDNDKKCVCPRFLASKPVGKRYIHLPLLSEAISSFGHEVRTDSHYCWIKNLSALVGSQMSKHQHKKFICDRCLSYFNLQTKLDKHKVLCENINECAIEMPEEGKNFEIFTNYKNELKVPFIVYADTEAILKPPETEVYSSKCSTQAHHQHLVHSIGYYFKSESDDSMSYYASHRGPDCIEWFMGELRKVATKVVDEESREQENNFFKGEEATTFPL